MSAKNATTHPTVKALIGYITAYDRDARKWHDEGERIEKRYKDQRPEGDAGAARFNVLWSNVETLKPFLYSQTPKPIVDTRHDNADETAKTAAEVLQRALAYTVAEGHFGSALRNARDDYLLPGRGTGWVRYKPTFIPAALQISESQVSDDPAQMAVPAGEDEQGVEKVEEVVGWEETITDYVHWKDFGHNVAPTWEEVDVVWRRVPMSRDALKARFGEEIGSKVPLDWRVKAGAKDDDAQERAAVYECWWKSKRKAIWISKGYAESPLDEKDDPLQLDHFWPCPKPVYATLTTDTLIPTPDFKQYRDQANEIDDLTARIAALTQAIKAAGIYDGNFPALKTLLQEGHDNELIPVDAYAALKEKGGLAGSLELLPMNEIVQTLLALHDAREKQKADLYEVTGMSDIIRGNTNPGETLGAQQIKVNFASKRLAERQAEVERFAANLIAIMGNIIAMHFSVDTLRAMTGVKLLTNAEKAQIQEAIAAQQAPQPQPPIPGAPPAPPQQTPQPAPAGVPPMGHNGGPALDIPADALAAMNKPSWEEVLALLQDEPQRRFSIDVETDSMVAADDQAEQAARTQFLEAVGGFLDKAMQAVEQQPAMAPLIGSMLMFAVRGFRVGRDLESTFQDFVDKMEQQAAQPQPPKPDPAMAKVQGELELQKQQQQFDQQRIQQQDQLAAQRAQQAQAHEQMIAERGAQQDASDSQAQMQMAAFKAHLDASLEQQAAAAKAQTDVLIARINALAKIAAAGEAKGATENQPEEQHQEEQGA